MSRKLREQAEYRSKTEKPGFILSKISLDAQVKSYLQRFEEEAVALMENFQTPHFKDKDLFESLSFLFEQQEEEGDDVFGDIFADTEADAGEADPAAAEQPPEGEMPPPAEGAPQAPPAADGSNDMGGELPVEVPDVNPSIDIESFGQNVLSLIDTAQHKLDFENAIMNISIKYLKEQYDPGMAKKLLNFFEKLGYNFVIQDED